MVRVRQSYPLFSKVDCSAVFILSINVFVLLWSAFQFLIHKIQQATFKTYGFAKLECIYQQLQVINSECVLLLIGFKTKEICNHQGVRVVAKIQYVQTFLLSPYSKCRATFQERESIPHL